MSYTATKSFHTFQCITSDCEDSCCRGWQVGIDLDAYKKYTVCTDPEFGKLFRKHLVKSDSPKEAYYADIKMPDAECPFLSKGLCSIHMTLGEGSLSRNCRNFPRNFNRVDGRLEKSLDLACPEAARAVLLDEQPVRLEQNAENADEAAEIGEAPEIDTADPEFSYKPYIYFDEIRKFVIFLLQNRGYTFEDRLVVLGLFCSELECTAAEHDNVPEFLREFTERLKKGGFESTVRIIPNAPAAFLKLLVTLIEYRIKTGTTGTRFLECFSAFKDGLGYSPDAPDALSHRYSDALARYRRMTDKRHDQIFENYFVNYVFGALFPLGPQKSPQQKRIYTVQKDIFPEYMLLSAQYAMMKNLLIGMAGFYKDDFSLTHIVKLIQSFVKNVVHDVAYQQRLLKFFHDNNMCTVACTAVMIKN